jgi:hypothetical protein
MIRQLNALAVAVLALASVNLTTPLNSTPSTQAHDLQSSSAPALAGCDQGPTRSQTSHIFDLDHVAADWGVFCEPSPTTGGYATWRKQKIADPSIDGEALECALTGGAPYSNIHCYRNLPPNPSTIAVTLTVTFLLLPGPTCTDLQTACVQALEFSVSKWQGQKRYEWALQWEQVGGPCPHWRYWNATLRDRWVDIVPPQPPIPQAGRWYTLALVGEIWQGQVRYVSFAIGEQSAPAYKYFFGPLDIPPATSTGNLNLLAVAIQLDGDSEQRPYSALLDQIALEQSSQPGFLELPRRQYLPLQLSQATTPGNGCP